jgi:hypothetical protein
LDVVVDDDDDDVGVILFFGKATMTPVDLLFVVDGLERNALAVVNVIDSTTT